MVEQHQEEQRVSTNSPLRRLKLKSLDSVLRFNRLRWFGHVKRGELYNGQILDLEAEGNRSRATQQTVGYTPPKMI